MAQAVQASRTVERRTPRQAFEPSMLVWVAAIVLLSFMVLVPLGWLAIASIRNGENTAWTLHNYVTAFGNPIYLRPIWNSLILATSVAVIAVGFGAPVAWLVSRTNMPGRNLVRALIMAAFVTPEFLGAEAWIFLAAPNSGWLNKIWVAIFHTEHGPLNIYTLWGAIFVIGVYTVPYTFTFVSGALEMLSAEIEDAAATLGAGPLQTAWRITLPIAMPAILGGFIMSFLEAFALFGAPAFLLIPARTQVVTTQLYEFFQYPIQSEVAAAYSMPLLLITIALLYVQRQILGRKTYQLVSGKGGSKRRHDIGRWGWLALGLALIGPICSLVLPYSALFLTSISRAWGLGPVPGNLTLHWYHWALFENQASRDAIVHSLTYGAAAATIAVVVAGLIGYAVVRKTVRGASILGFICMAPFVVPGIVMAIGFFSAYSRPPIVLYGTAGILIMAFATRFLPIAFSNVTNIVRSVNPELENAARSLGAGRLEALRTITVPLLRRGFLASWLLVFIPALRELSSAIFLSSPQTAVMTTLIYDFSDSGNYEAVATMGIMMMIITFIVVVIAYRLLGRDFMRRESEASA